jgi:DnaJ-class molecular chaperone
VFAWRQFQEISHAYSILSDKQKREKYDRFGDDEELEGDADMEAFMAMFGEIFASMGAGGPGGLFGDFDDDDMDEFFMDMGMGRGGPGMGGMGMPPGMMGGFFAMDGEDLGSEEEEEILEEFMMAHSEQVPLAPLAM